MFGLSILELRLAIYGVLLAAISGYLVYERHHLISEGEARIEAQDASARAAQRAEDAKVSQGVIDDLQSKLAGITVVTPPRVLLCSPPRSVRPNPTPGGPQPAVATVARESGSGVPAGATSLDIGPSLSDLKRGAEVIAVYRDETYDWAVKESHGSGRPH